MAENDVDLDSIIDRLLEVRGSRPGKQVQLLETEIRFLCTKAREIFISQPILLELEAPIKVRVQISRVAHRNPQTREDIRLFRCTDSSLAILDMWGHSRAVLRLAASVRVRRLPPGGELLVPW